MTSKISIVTISFNQAEYIRECIESVLSQKPANIEYIVVDPGSTDGSREIIESYRDEIDTLLLEPDAGPADGLRKGFDAATGDVFGYLNADDRFCPGALEFVQTRFDAEPDMDVLCGAIRIIDEKGGVSARKRTADRFDLRRYVAGICTIGQQATFFRSRIYRDSGGFNPDNRITWDGELLVDMALAGGRFRPVRKVLGDFRIYPTSITGSNAHVEAQLREFERVADKLRARGVEPYSSATARLLKLLYKLNVPRHIGYLTVR